jgi:hypothetical protein
MSLVYVLRTFVGTNLSPRWEELLNHSEGAWGNMLGRITYLHEDFHIVFLSSTISESCTPKVLW